MKLLFDENTSPQLVQLLADIFPESVHVRDVGLQSATDETIWQFAITQGLMIGRRIQTCISEVSCLVIHPKSFGFDWAIVPLPK